MSSDAYRSTPRERAGGWKQDLLTAALAASAALVIYAFGGFASLADPDGDNDALMRLVQVRDLIAGQGWFDLTQYRMGLEGGLAMHWSRLVDAPIAALVLAATAVTGGQATGEAIALVLWPHLLYAAALVLILRITRRAAGERALLPAVVIGAVTLHVSGLFAPGSLDHHTLQLVLTLALLNFLLADADDRTAAYGAGAAAALMIAVGMETLPYVATGGLCAAVLFLLHGKIEAARARRFGAAFAIVSLFAFVLTVPSTAWLAAQCDAFSVAQASLAAVAGFGLWAVARFTSADGGVFKRAAGIAALAGLLAAVVLLAFPQCLGDPYAGLDPRLHTYWLDGIMEAQSVADLLADDLTQVAAYYATPVLGLFILAAGARRKGFRRQDAILGGFLASAVLVSLWQVRGSMFSLPLAVIPLAAWVAEWRAQAESFPSRARNLKPLLAWLLSFNLVWHSAANAAVMLAGQQTSGNAGEEERAEECYRAADYARLAAFPSGTVLAVSNLGASILAHTKHRALAGSYHRNADGNLVTLDALMGPAGQARDLLDEAGVDIVAFCPGNHESRSLAAWAPDGLEAALRLGEVPEWLTPAPGGESATLRIYRVLVR